jgi:haloacetate dehalogenase
MTDAGQDVYAGFTLAQVDVGEVSLRVRHGGDGPPLLLLHGFPETHLMWHAVAGSLAERFTVVAPDLRGYGGSSTAPDDPEHRSQSKRVMAGDAVALMAHLGFGRFDVAGHDRGGRVGYRLALDRPDAVRRLSVLDIIPTGEVWARADANFALGYWHWGLLAQPAPLPETMAGHDPDWFFLDAHFAGIVRTFHPSAVADYQRSVREPRVIHAMAEDYRAGATFDRALDDDDRAAGRQIGCPTQVLWGSRGRVGRWYDPLEIWRDWAPDVTGQAIDSGHFLPEENPADTLAALLAFHSAG